MSRNGYNNAFATVVACPHSRPEKNEEGEIIKISTWQKYQVERYHGRMEKCSICKQKRVLDTSEEGVIGYVEQASLF